jgi:hypothetical protein
VSEKRLSLLSNGHVRYELKTPYRDRKPSVSDLAFCLFERPKLADFVESDRVAERPFARG